MSEGSPPSAPWQTQAYVDREQQERIARYRSARRRTFNPLSAGLGLAFFFFVLPGAYNTIAGIVANPGLAWHPLANWYPIKLTLIYGCVIGIVSTYLLPFSFLGDYLFARIYHIRQITLPVWLSSWLLRSIIRAFRWLLFFELCYFFITVQPESWWIWAAFVLSAYQLGKGYIFPRVLSSYLFEHVEITDGDLISVLNELIGRSIRKTGIHSFFLIQNKVSKRAGRKEVRPNAYLAGWGRTRSIILTDGLLKNFTLAEIRVILAHELGHHAHHDLSKRQIFQFLLLAGELFSWNIAYHWCLSLPNPQDYHVLSQGYYWLLLLLGIRVGSYLLKRAYSRRTEWQADEFALQLTWDVQAFKSAMIRLMNANHLTYMPETELEHTHPATYSRLHHADKFAAHLAHEYKQA